ncbi:LysR family transcriptional regulator [Methylobacterium mesophilicum SR1.6/6]|uniref:LysR family transcriptional regulator n=2 Tax=Methylobacterium mesophilicum TaxID=39956 RepID=A0A6B9FVF0_9HYPH|nr:LysR substrate-binding domain-containing protein [Methylobacterium mesophilicum]QGY05952.1 LysR family transcriptional regulator [Methylobacterium mesophilicum SR1.6/6]
MGNLDIALLRSFLAVVESNSFTTAAQALGLRQSTVSGHIARLEQALGRPVLARDTHRVALTLDGQALIGFARDVVQAQDRLCAFFSPGGLRGRIRLGVSEDYTLSALARVLARFADRHDAVDLQITVGLSRSLYQGYDAGELDVIFCKRRRGDPRGALAWAEPLIWTGRPGFVLDLNKPVPLVLYPPPSMTRTLALDALDAAGRSWRIACTSGSLMGLCAAVEAGLGIAPHSAKVLPPGLAAIPETAGLPALGDVEFVVLGPGRHDRAATALQEAILTSTAELQGSDSS